jgi:hypothetical protein
MSKYTKKLQERYLVPHYASATKFLDEGLAAIDLYKKRFFLSRHVNYKPYYPRKEQRYVIIVEYFRKYLEGSILDVGSRNNLLSQKLGKPVSLVDKNNPELLPFNWEKEHLPYEDNFFDTIVCLDTLEHIDDLHDGFYDLLRVAKKNIIISLPNNWKKAFNEFIKGRGRWPAYGIPLEKPPDRHKWFFNTEEAEDFVFYHSASTLGNYKIREVQYHIPKTIWRIKILYPIFRLILPEYHFKNLFVGTIFFVLEKRDVKSDANNYILASHFN